MKCRKKWKLSSTLLTRILFTPNYARERLVSHPSYKHTTVKPVLDGIFLQWKGFEYLVVAFHAGFTVLHDLYRHVRKGQTQRPVSWCQTGLGKTRPFFYFLIHKGECTPVYAVKIYERIGGETAQVPTLAPFRGEIHILPLSAPPPRPQGKIPHYPLRRRPRGPKSWSVVCGREKTLLPLPIMWRPVVGNVLYPSQYQLLSPYQLLYPLA